MNKIFLSLALVAGITGFARDSSGQEVRDPEVDRQLIGNLLQLNQEANEARIARLEEENAALQRAVRPQRVPSELINPRDTVVRVKTGGYRLSVYYNSGEGGNIASEGDEVEVIAPEVERGIALGREFLDKRDNRMAGDIDKLFSKPFTRIETRTVVVQQPCPQPVVPYCAGLRRSGYCCGITRNCGPAVVAAPVVATPVVTAVRHSCSCGGVGCSHCRHANVGVVATATTTYGRCAAWSRVTTRLAIYQDPPLDRHTGIMRPFWCNCADHIARARARYGYDVVWELVPCMCAHGCSQCGGAGRCGTH